MYGLEGQEYIDKESLRTASLSVKICTCDCTKQSSMILYGSQVLEIWKLFKCVEMWPLWSSNMPNACASWELFA